MSSPCVRLVFGACLGYRVWTKIPTMPFHFSVISNFFFSHCTNARYLPTWFAFPLIVVYRFLVRTSAIHSDTESISFSSSLLIFFIFLSLPVFLSFVPFLFLCWGFLLACLLWEDLWYHFWPPFRRGGRGSSLIFDVYFFLFVFLFFVCWSRPLAYRRGSLTTFWSLLLLTHTCNTVLVGCRTAKMRGGASVYLLQGTGVRSDCLHWLSLELSDSNFPFSNTKFIQKREEQARLVFYEEKSHTVCFRATEMRLFPNENHHLIENAISLNKKPIQKPMRKI